MLNSPLVALHEEEKMVEMQMYPSGWALIYLFSININFTLKYIYIASTLNWTPTSPNSVLICLIQSFSYSSLNFIFNKIAIERELFSRHALFQSADIGCIHTSNTNTIKQKLRRKQPWKIFKIQKRAPLLQEVAATIRRG